MPALRAPAEKLPLTTRKNLRDEWEAKKPEYEGQMKTHLGEAWTISFDPNLIYVYASDDYKPRLGSVVTWYMDALVSNVKRFAENFGSDGVQELNAVCFKHQVYFAPQEKTSFSYGGLVVEDGVLNLVFNEKSLASNVDDVSRDFATALKNAPPPPGATAFSLVARNAVKQDFDSKMEDLLPTIRTALNMPNLVLNGNFEENSAILSKTKAQSNQDWDKRIGFISYEYFDSLRYNLDRNNFKDDDMQQEAFQEAVDKGEVCLRILPKWDDGKSRYSELKIEDGKLYMQTTEQNWGVNVSDAFAKLLDIL